MSFAALEEREKEIAFRERDLQIGSRNTYKKSVQKLRKQQFEKLRRNNDASLSSSPTSPVRPVHVEVGENLENVLELSAKNCSKKKGNNQFVIFKKKSRFLEIYFNFLLI